jgi:transcriptional regulator with XRE-family HTH domain
MREIDKLAVGGRIRDIRRGTGLKQWELAKILGTTQSAVHKYEHGVIPEPRRLLELARAGDTTIEWILTGRHGEGGDDRRERLPEAVLRTAVLLREVVAADAARVNEALMLLREASRAQRGEGEPSPVPADGTIDDVRAPDVSRVLDAARRIQHAVLKQIVREAEGRLLALPFSVGPDAE